MVQVQNHIHLDPVLSDTGPEYAPATTWVIMNYIPQQEIMAAVRYGAGGRLFAHVVSDDSGPIKRENYQLRIRIAGDTEVAMRAAYELIKSYNGKQLYYVDSYHPDNGSSHRDYVKRVWMKIEKSDPVSVGLVRFYVDVTLLDDSIETTAIPAI